MSRKKTTEQFKAELALVQPTIEVLGEYKGANTKIRIIDEFGECECRARKLLSGSKPTIQSAIDKNAYFIAQAREVWGDKYDYSKVNYVKGNEKVTIICPEHGKWQQKPQDHLYGYGCSRCFYESGKLTGGNGGYNITTAERNRTEWIETPAIVYKIECWNDTERFIKVGITMRTVKERFHSDMPYNYKILQELHVDLYEAIYMEEALHKELEAHKYTPKIKFGGHTECFKIDQRDI